MGSNTPAPNRKKKAPKAPKAPKADFGKMPKAPKKTKKRKEQHKMENVMSSSSPELTRVSPHLTLENDDVDTGDTGYR